MKCLKNLGQNAKDAGDSPSKSFPQMTKIKPWKLWQRHLVAYTDEILKANALDVENGKKNQMPEGLIDRLMLTPERIEGMADGLRQLTGLEDPIGEVTGMKKRPNGLLIGQKRVPLRCDRHHLRSTSECNLRCIRSLLQNRKCCDPEGWK